MSKQERQELTGREKQLVEFMRQLGWGEILLRVEDGQPVLIYEAIRTYKLIDKESKTTRTRVWRAE